MRIFEEAGGKAGKEVKGADAGSRPRIRVRVEPRWSEDYELVRASEGIGVKITGGLDDGDHGRVLRVDVTVPSGSSAGAEEIALAVPQRCDLHLLAKSEYFHEVFVGGGQGRIEGDLRVVIPHGDIAVQKVRGENVELRTGAGRVDVKSVLEGLNTDISSSAGFTAKRVMGDNVTVRVGGLDGLRIAAAYGNQFFLQSRDGPVTVDTAQVSMLDVRAGGAPGVDVGGMSGVLLAHAAPSDKSHAEGDNVVGVSVSFDQVGHNPSAAGITKADAVEAGASLRDPQRQPPERSVLRCDGGGSIAVSLSDEQPLNLDLNLRSALADGVKLPVGVERGEYTPGRQAAAGFQANALVSGTESPSSSALSPTAEGVLSPAKTIFEGTVEGDRAEGWLRSGPRAKGRGGRGGSGKIRMDQGDELLDPNDSSLRPHLSAISDGKISVSVAGWMDRIRSKYLD